MADPVVISPTAQEFGGERFYLCGLYFQRNGRRLHVAVWEARCGPRPRGHEIHHKDEDRSNNTFDNLECLPTEIHRGLHARERWEKSPRFRRNIHLAQQAARAWHGSAAARGLHVRLGRVTVARAAANPVAKRCEACGEMFQDRSLSKGARTCSKRCYMRLFRRERREGKRG